MRSAIKKNVFREIKSTLGRYIAIIAIVALGVGFFSGLKITKPSMVKTGNKYISEHNMYDFRLISGIGFEHDDVDYFNSLADTEYAEGGFFTDFLYSAEGKNTGVLRAHLLNKNINTLSVVSGRLPESGDEIVVDANVFGKEYIGKKIKVINENSDDTKANFKYDEYEIVGTVDSVYYLNVERGSTSLAGGKVAAFVYITEEGLNFDYYTEIFVTLKEKENIFSDEYDSLISLVKDGFSSSLTSRVNDRYNRILSDAREDIEKARSELEKAKNDYERGETELSEKESELEKAKENYNALLGSPYATQEMISAVKEQIENAEKLISDYRSYIEEAKAEIDSAEDKIHEAEEELVSFTEPVTYVFTRNENTGYACFKSDSSIVDGIAKVFPLFFFLVAALVCITTMTRMVEEQRTQIGTLKALGYSNSSIAWKYIFYSGSAAVIGCVFGFFIGTWLFPLAIWKAYGMLYGFADIEYLFDPLLAFISLVVSLLCSVAAAYVSVRKELLKMPAEMMRPKAPKPGKRVFLERIHFIWNRMKFLHKVSARNILRYKKRMFMMILGIGGCTALLLTGMGIRDSISNIADDQYENILKYDYDIMLEKPADGEFIEDFYKKTDNILSDAVFIRQTSVNASADDGVMKKVYLIVTDDMNISSLIDLHDGENKIAYPSAGEAVVTEKFASVAGISVGDFVNITVNDTKSMRLLVSGICENYVYSYVYINADTYTESLGEEVAYNTVFAKAASGKDIHEVSAELIGVSGVASVTVSADLRERVSDMMESLGAIIWLVIASAGALAFVVLFNLSNINITERQREIATIKVLGFYRKETTSYVFRENMVLTFMGAVVGLPLGYLLHRFVMSQINIDLVSFNVRILPVSYIIALILTFAFSIIVEIFMKRKIDHIDMAESLKSIE